MRFWLKNIAAALLLVTAVICDSVFFGIVYAGLALWLVEGP